MNKKRIIILLIIVLSLNTIIGCDRRPKDAIATVDGETILKADFEEMLRVNENLYNRQLGEGELDKTGSDGITFREKLKNTILEQMIMELLIEKQAIARGITITDDEVNKTVEDYVESMGGQEEFDKFIENIEMSKDNFSHNARKTLLANKLKEDEFKNLNITDEEIESFFQNRKDEVITIKARHILVGTEEEAIALINKLEFGDSFETLARINSLDSVSALKGGDLGYFTKGSFISEFEEAAFSLKEGETSKPIKTEVGYHIIKVDDVKDTIDELKDSIVLKIKTEKYENYLKKLRSEAKVRKYLD